jgi:two-component system sensor histidine kinase ChiS
VLIQIRDRLLRAVRDMDTVVRWGGDEFLLVARQCDRSQAWNLADRVEELVSGELFDIGNGQTLSLTCSLGFAPYPVVPSHPPGAVSWIKVVEMADRCLYAAKESGRNGWVGVCQGPSPERIAGFIFQPEQEIKRGGWDIVTSFSDVSTLVWHREKE